MPITHNESNAITWLRVSAMFSIVLCHLYQAYGVIYSSYFNVGVQVFFLLSGFLYASKRITNWPDWWKRRWVKLYIPYLLCLCLSLCYLSFVKGGLNAPLAVGAHLFNLQGFRQVFHCNSLLIDGIQHFWFMTGIMASYSILPVLQRIAPPPQYIVPKKSSHAISIAIFSMLLLVGAYAYLPGGYLFGLEWLWLFAFGYLYSRMSVSVRRFIILISCIIVLICLYRIHYDGSILWSNFNRCNRVFHCALGIFLFSTAVFICTMRVPKWVSCMDFYSYEIYLAHFVFMIGPGSLIGKTGSKIGDIMLMLLLSGLVACFLKYASRYLTGIFQKDHSN